MRVDLKSALMLCVCPAAIFSLKNAQGAAAPAWDAGIVAEIVVPRGSNATLESGGMVALEKLDIALVIDISNSMRGWAVLVAPNGGDAKSDWAESGAKAFVDALPDDSRVALTSFAFSPQTSVPIAPLGSPDDPAGQRAAIRSALDAYTWNGGGTNITRAIEYATELLIATPDSLSSHVVLVSDGEPTAGGNPRNAAAAALAAGVAVHTISLPGADERILAEAASYGGGRFVSGSDLTLLINDFVSIVEDADPLARIDIVNDLGVMPLEDLPLDASNRFIAPLTVAAGENISVARTTSSRGLVRESRLTIYGVVVPEPATLTIGVIVTVVISVCCPREAYLNGSLRQARLESLSGQSSHDYPTPS